MRCLPAIVIHLKPHCSPLACNACYLAHSISSPGMPLIGFTYVPMPSPPFETLCLPVTRVQSGGHVKVQLNLMTKVGGRDSHSFGDRFANLSWSA